MPGNSQQTSSSTPQTATCAIADVFNYALYRGVSEHRLSAETGLVRTDLINPETRLPGELFHSIWNLIAEACPGQAVGIQNARRAPLSSLGSLPQPMKYAENLRSALKTLVCYGSLLSDQLCLELVEFDSEAFLQLYHPLDVLDGGIAAESCMGLIWRSVQQAIGKEDSLVRVELAQRPHGLPRFYEAFFGVPVYFQRPYNALVFRQAALDTPTKQRDDDLFRYLQGNLDLLRDRWGLSDNTSPLADIHHTITHKAEFYQYSAEEIARDMNMSLRSLQRLMNQHGFTVRQLLENVRREKACQLLSNPTLNIEVIATQLGYSDDRAFRRAFKRWTGQTPAEFRVSLMGRT